MKCATFVLLLSGFVTLTQTSYVRADPLQHVHREYGSPEEASRKIGQLADELYKYGDHRGFFPAIYSITIASTVEELRRGRFQNPRWARQLVLNYANLYRRTIYAELIGRHDRVPLSWQLAFAYARGSYWQPELDAVYGINVHIARDLIEALFVTPTNFDSASMRADYYYISEILGSAMPAIWNAFGRYRRGPQFAACLQQAVMVNWIVKLRHEVWLNARSARALSAAEKTEFIDAIDVHAYQMAVHFGLLLPLQ